MLLVIASKPLFELGQVCLTSGTHALMLEGQLDVNNLINRHVSGDWSDMCEEDRQTNQDAITHGDRIFSSFNLPTQKVWVITEYDRSVTTILLPDEY
ncbi:MAG TPA: hypothetical protein PKC44_03385 [Agitococcus sp.]|nr:hypothetical protein [Agitococcus sp.]